MSGLQWRLAALALLLGLAVGGRAAWLWQDKDYGQQLSRKDAAHAQEREQASTAALVALQEEQARHSALAARLQTNDKTHYEELKNAQTAQQRLRDRLATADLRLSVLIAGSVQPAQGGACGVSATTGAVGVVHGAARAELDPAHAQRIVGITSDGDDGLRALAGCQAYVREVSRGGPL